MRKALFFCFIIFIIVIYLTSGPGCANIVPPQGGPRDSTPPVLLKAEPLDSTVNFRAKNITLSFDEFIDLREIQNNLLFTPTFQNNPEIKEKGRSLTITFRDSLESNTTYILNFGNAVTDLNEGNVLKNFVYSFSTGPYMDSLEISGKVLLAETGMVDSTLTIVLHRKLYDSAVVRDRPMYIARLDRDGNFNFRNLPADTFAIYAIGDAGISRRYQNKNQLFAFADSPVVAGITDSVLLYAYRETPPKTASVIGPTVKTSATDRRLRFNPGTVGQQDLFTDFVLNFPVPLKSFDSTKLSLTTDSTYNPTPFSTTIDTSQKEVRIKSQWKENTVYHLILEKEFATDTTDRQLLKSDTLIFTTKKLADYGKLSIRIRNINPDLNPVLQLVQGNEVKFSASVKSGQFNQDLFPPGDYDLRILFDANGNGKWDPGQFFGTKKQPELIKTIEGKITVKPNWENEFERSL